VADAGPIPIIACVTPNERKAIEAGSMLLADALESAGGEGYAFTTSFVDDLVALSGGDRPSVIIISMLAQIGTLDEPWSEIEGRLRRACAALNDQGRTAMICTILRHVDPAGADTRLLLRRIRRLNLLATELSREFGALVIDIDRVFANLGAWRLATDYRLGGPAAIDLAARTLALGIVSDALDPFVPFELQAEAHRQLDAHQLPVDNRVDIELARLTSWGAGRRRQTVSIVSGKADSFLAGSLLRRLVGREIGLGDLLGKGRRMVRQRGWRQTARVLFSATVRLPKMPR
jgi:hypothetical protein